MTVREDFCPECGAILAVLTEKDQVISDLERELRVKRATISRMQHERDRAQDMSPFAKDVEAVFAYWKKRCRPRARECSGDRFDKVAARLRAGATVDEIKRAIDGAAALPYVTDHGRTPTGPAKDRQDELELICRSEAHLQRFQRYAEPVEPEASTGSPDPPFLPHDRLASMQAAIDQPGILERLSELRGWSSDAVLGLGLGLDSGRVVFPVHGPHGALVGLCRYQPNPAKRNGQPKNLAQGERGLFPAPESLDEGDEVWLVEGEPDAVAMRSIGLPAVGVPGVATWKRDWSERFRRFSRVYICFDCDEQGRKAAAERLDALSSVTRAATIDLDPDRDDGYDVSDLVLAEGKKAAATLVARAAVASTKAKVVPMQRTIRLARDDGPTEDAYPRIIAALEAHDCRVREKRGGMAEAQCPAHEDRQPSLSISAGDDGRALLTCHAGCDTEDIMAALGLELRDLFPRAASS